jgi:hypothetical protein
VAWEAVCTAIEGDANPRMVKLCLGLMPPIEGQMPPNPAFSHQHVGLPEIVYAMANQAILACRPGLFWISCRFSDFARPLRGPDETQVNREPPNGS